MKYKQQTFTKKKKTRKTNAKKRKRNKLQNAAYNTNKTPTKPNKTIQNNPKQKKKTCKKDKEWSWDVLHNNQYPCTTK